MAVWYSLWSFGKFFPFGFDWTKKNLATLLVGNFETVTVFLLPPVTSESGKKQDREKMKLGCGWRKENWRYIVSMSNL
jgi:hypothetical protein